MNAYTPLLTRPSPETVRNTLLEHIEKYSALLKDEGQQSASTAEEQQTVKSNGPEDATASEQPAPDDHEAQLSNSQRELTLEIGELIEDLDLIRKKYNRIFWLSLWSAVSSTIKWIILIAIITWVYRLIFPADKNSDPEDTNGSSKAGTYILIVIGSIAGLMLAYMAFTQLRQALARNSVRRALKRVSEAVENRKEVAESDVEVLKGPAWREIAWYFVVRIGNTRV